MMKHKLLKQRINFHGLQFRLYLIFLSLTILITTAIGVVQYQTYRVNLRAGLENRLMDAGHNISSAYTSTAYQRTLRATIDGGEYRVRVVNETGEILADTNQMSFYIQWPDIALSQDQIISLLDNSNGFFYTSAKDVNGIEWLIYGQLLAAWHGVREILLVTTNTQEIQLQSKKLLLSLFEFDLIIFLLAFIVCWLLAKSFLKPLAEITQKAALLAEGDYSVSFPRGGYTEIDTLAEVLDHSVQEISNYEQNRRNMVANVSHDLRTPLTVIKAYAEMIQTFSGDNPQKRNEHLSVIIAQTDKLSDFVNASLNLSRLQAGQVKLERNKFCLSELVHEYINQLQQAKNDQYTFILDLAPNCYVEADYMRIEEIVNNLVSNAMKYGDGRIHLKVFPVDDYIRLEIIDYGKGIPEDKLHLIWTRHYMVNPYVKDSGNSGVGLSIVKELADLHGLKYGVESPPGQGTCFWFLFKRI